MCGPCVVIPICHIDTMTYEQMGAAVRQLAPEATYAEALDIAEHIVWHANGERNHGCLLGEDYAEKRALLESFAGRGGYKVAVAHGGTHDLDNLQLLCEPWNGHKSDRE